MVNFNIYYFVCVCVCACVRTCVHACAMPQNKHGHQRTTCRNMHSSSTL